MNTRWLLGGIWLCTFVLAAEPVIYHDGWTDLNKNGVKDTYEDPTQPVAKRVNDLLKRMTLDEKIGQLWEEQMESDSDIRFADKLKRGALSSFLDGSVLIETPMMRNKIQHIAVEQSRLGIPLIFANDVIHGFRTIFPIPLALACAWEPELFAQTDTIAAREAAAAGLDWTFAPMVDLARDPRWGRIAEGFGEDPWLGALDAAASVRGFQGANIAETNRIVGVPETLRGLRRGGGRAGLQYDGNIRIHPAQFLSAAVQSWRGRGGLDGDERIQRAFRNARQRQPSHAHRHFAR